MSKFEVINTTSNLTTIRCFELVRCSCRATGANPEGYTFRVSNKDVSRNRLEDNTWKGYTNRESKMVHVGISEKCGPIAYVYKTSFRKITIGLFGPKLYAAACLGHEAGHMKRGDYEHKGADAFAYDELDSIESWNKKHPLPWFRRAILWLVERFVEIKS